MKYKDTLLWKKLEGNISVKNQHAMESLCDAAITMLKTVRDTFPTYTLHDEVHVVNVIHAIENLLGEEGIGKLTEGETELLLLAACYHDIGMCYSKQEKQSELNSIRFKRYLEQHPSADVLMFENEGEIPAKIQVDFFRSIHHERIAKILKDSLDVSNVRRDRLIKVCQSHGENIERVKEIPYDNFNEIDYCFCAVLLRLGDILDFDVTRSPEILYEYQKIEDAQDRQSVIEWRKHQSSLGFRYPKQASRDALAFRAVSNSMQTEHFIHMFLDYIDLELRNCSEVISNNCSDRWRNLALPIQIDRSGIESNGYRTGEYHLTMDSERVLELLVGNDLYTHSAVFIRELLQNSLDAIGTRRMLDRNYGFDSWMKEKPSVVITTWMDPDGNDWLRVDDNGIGMTEKIILDYFLKVGRSYYTSPEFYQGYYRNKDYYDYKPISQFGIGILSCFLCGDRIEVSTRHYKEGHGIRFGMIGTSGYYSLADEENGDTGEMMPSMDESGREPFRQTPGTSIAVRMNLFRHENSGSVKNIVKDYVLFPDVPIVYKDSYETIYFPMAEELVEDIKANQVIRIPFTDEEIDYISRSFKEICWVKRPEIVLECRNIQDYVPVPSIRGGTFLITVDGELAHDLDFRIGDIRVGRSLNQEISFENKMLHILMSYEMHWDGVSDSGLNVGGLESVVKEMFQKYKDISHIHRQCGEMLQTKKYSKEQLLQELNGNDGDVASDELEEIVNRGLEIYNGLERTELSNRSTVNISVPLERNPQLKRLAEKYMYHYMEGRERGINGVSVTAYNGIKVNWNWSDYSWLRQWVNYTIVLLQGRFKPMLNMSRERVKHFSVETMGYLSVLERRLPGTELDYGQIGYYDNCPLSEYLILLNNAEFSKAAESVYLCGINLTIEKLKTMLKENDEDNGICLNTGSLSHSNSFEIENRPDENIVRALVQKNCRLKCKMSSNGCSMSLYAIGLREDGFTESELVFPPLLFAESDEADSRILTEENSIGRNIINASHPFSRWLTDNAIELERSYRGSLNAIIKCLREEDGDIMTAEINKILQNLRMISRCKVRVPNDIDLKGSDFLRIE